MSKPGLKVGGTVWVLYIDYDANQKLKVFTTNELAKGWLHDYVVANWNPEDFDGGDPCEAPEDAIEMYFEANDDESWWIQECPITGG